MLLTHYTTDYMDAVCMYGFCNETTVTAAAEYQWPYPWRYFPAGQGSFLPITALACTWHHSECASKCWNTCGGRI